MKFSKADNIRVYVSKKEKPEGRGNLYRATRQQVGKKVSIEGQIMDRVDEAKDLYGVFFKPDVLSDPEKHFERIVSQVNKNSGGGKGTLLKYYKDNKSLNKSGRKNLKSTPVLYVRERMGEFWQTEPYRDAASEILACICKGKDYKEAVEGLSDDTLNAFEEACREWPRNRYGEKSIFIEYEIPNIANVNSSDNTLEGYFSALLKSMVTQRQCAKHIDAWQNEDEQKKSSEVERQINWLEKCSYLEIESKKDKVKVYLNKISWKWATDDRLRAILVRMRRSLKRGSNAEVAVKLMQGLAQKDGRTLSSVIGEMKEDEEQRKKLEKFVDAVIRDYYHINALKSIRRTDVKVQSTTSAGDTLLYLSSAGKPQKEEANETSAEKTKEEKLKEKSEVKAALNKTLLDYASSAEKSDEVWEKLQTLLSEYFEVPQESKSIPAQEPWAIPLEKNEDNKIDERKNKFFDEPFEEVAEKKGEQKAGRPLRELWGKAKLPEEKPPIAEIKNRINYVNYGKYLRLIRDGKHENAFDRYWLKFIKEYVEKDYTGSRKITQKACYTASMHSACWKEMVRFLCGKYIDIGKAVYHFAMPTDLTKEGDVVCGQVGEAFENGISSFDYEAIQAEETLQRDVSVITVAAVSAFSNSVVDEEKRENFIEKENQKEERERQGLEDIMFIPAPLENKNGTDKILLWDMTKKDAVRQLLRFYGGVSSFSETVPETEKIRRAAAASENGLTSEQKELISELLSHLKAIRNENFHYTTGRKDELKTDYTKELWENDRKAYTDSIKKRYYSNNTGMIYPEEDLQKLVRSLYANERAAEAQIPSFRKVWKQSDLLAEVREKINSDPKGPLNNLRINEGKQDQQEIQDRQDKQKKFGNALYFLLQEIYYNDFILNPKAKDDYFFKAAEDYAEKKSGDKKNGPAIKNFNGYIDKLRGMGDSLTFGGVCQMIQHEYNRQNAKKGKGEIFKHYKMLLPIYVKNAFIKFLDEEKLDEKKLKKYGFLKNPRYKEISGEPDFLEDVELPSMEFPNDPQLAAWFTFAHFIHPRQLNHLFGDFKSYVQYREDILRRMEYAGEAGGKELAELKKDVRSKTQDAQPVLRVFEFVRKVSVRVSGNLADYYSDKDDKTAEDVYAEYLSKYVEYDDNLIPGRPFESLKEFCRDAFPDGEAVYADEGNPKLLRNVELARMYGGGDMDLPGRKPVSKEEIKKYYRNKGEVDNLLAKKLRKDEQEQFKVLEQQWLRSRMTLNDVTDICAIVNDLLGRLIRLAYLRERDQMYLFLGFYYMALRSPSGWEGEEDMHSVEFSGCNITEGLVLYQVVGIFDFGVDMPARSKNKWKWREGELSGKLISFYRMHGESMDRVLRLFGKDKDPDPAVELRNYVDHGKYYATHSRSIVQLYADAYNLFFSYSRKLRNSVAYNFKSVPERYFVEAKLNYRRKEDSSGKKISGFAIDGLKSTKFTYKLEGGKTCDLPAKDEKFIAELKNVLEYSQEDD